MAKTKKKFVPFGRRRRNPKQRPKPAREETPEQPDAPLTPGGRGDTLSDEQRTIIVQRLAMFDTPQQLVDFVREDWGLEITRQSIQHYDPTHGEKPAEKWCQIFEATRAEFLKSTADIPIANKSVRLRRLERMALAAERMKNFALAALLHEQAAKEVGDVYTNKSKVDLNARHPITGVTVEIHNKDGAVTTENLT